MNYRHAFHAGNFADVFKHAVLARILVYLTRKDAPMRYLDTHAGIGRYDLASSEAERGGEWRDGVGRLASAAWSPDAQSLLDPYLRVLGPFVDGAPEFYPGSPLLAQKLLRSQDRMIFCEAHREDAQSLAEAIGRDRRAKAIEIDGYTALRAYTPPVERRGLVLIDPPFESTEELRTLGENLRAAYAKWPTGVYAVWRPLKDARALLGFDASLARDGLSRLLRLTFAVGEIRKDGPLAASSLLLVNPPYVLEQEARILLPELLQRLRRDQGATWSVERVEARAIRA